MEQDQRNIEIFTNDMTPLTYVHARYYVHIFIAGQVHMI